jgi:hypothetical protein
VLLIPKNPASELTNPDPGPGILCPKRENIMIFKKTEYKVTNKLTSSAFIRFSKLEKKPPTF